MGCQWLHLIDATGLHTYICKQVDFTSPMQNFAADESGHAAFRAWLAGTARHDIHRVLSDIADDTFVLDSIPHARGPDRQALLARKISQHFAAPYFAYAISLGREPQGRRDERVLLAGLGTATLLKPWLDALMAGEHLMHSVGSIAEQGIQCLPNRIEPSLLLSWSPAGMRISLYKSGRLHFSRLLHAHSNTEIKLAALSAQAVQQSIHYLHTQHYLDRHEKLIVIVLGDATLASEIKHSLFDEDELQVRHCALNDLARQHALKYAEIANNCRPLLIQLACQTPPRAQLAPAPMRRNYQAHRIARTAYAVCALCLLSSVCVVGWQLLSASRIGQETQALRTLASQYDHDYASWRAQMPVTPVAFEQIASLNTEILAFSHSQPSMRAALRHLSQALERNRQITLLSLDWQRLPHTTEALATSAELHLHARIDRSAEQAPQPSGATWAQVEAFRQTLEQNPSFSAHLQTPQTADEAGFSMLLSQLEES